MIKIESPPCPRCHSADTTAFTTVHRDDPLCFCMVCQHFWRPLDDADGARELKEPDAPTSTSDDDDGDS